MPTEVAHILFLDIAAFSRGSMEQQARLTTELRDLVRKTPEFVRATAAGEIIGLDTGDGMALVFFRDPLAPLQCAVEIARGLSEHRHLILRMGIHSGPVSRTTDLNGRENVTGSGINTAQRVMDSGDPGHILLSSASAEVAREFDAWAGFLHDLGECEVKHGRRVHLYSFIMDTIGRPEPPSRIAASAPEAPPMSVPPAAAGAFDRRACKVVLLYKRGSAPDENLLRILEAELKSNGDDVFIDRHLQIGVAWAQEIERRIREADAVVPLLSAASHRSEMLEFEVQTAHQAAQAQGGKPRILPVRVAYTEPFADPIGSILGSLQYTLWNGREDDARVVADVIRALHSPPAPPQAVKREPIGGAMSIDSQFYIVRPTDATFLEAIANRDSIVLVKGARQMGKTSLLARGLHKARADGVRVAMTDFQTFSSSILASADSLFLALSEDLADQLDLEADPRRHWNPDLGANTNMERFVRRQVLGAIDGPLVWGLDEVDRLFPPGCAFGSEVFGLFRSWHNRRSLDPGGPWARLTLAIAYATEAHLFITDLNQSPFNVGTRLTLDDFDPAQVADLNERFGRPLPNADAVARFHALVGGQPYLTSRGLDDIGRRSITIDVLDQEADRDESLFGDHLRRILITLLQDTALTEVARGILRGKPCPTPESFYRLRSAGLISGTNAGDVRFRCRLYERFLARHLL
ncbi:MAG: AAA-like domain-containing protein [Capsulimonadaceae bacterium]